MGKMTGLLERVAEIYRWLDSQNRGYADLAGSCRKCGDCCDFDTFGHRLFVTPPELMYLVANLGSEKTRVVSGGRCPYNLDGKCTVYKHRFAGCRVFCCGADADFQSTLSESVLERLKSICAEYEIAYRYMDLASALNDVAAV